MEGYSNFLWLLILGGSKRLFGAGIVASARALGVAASAITVAAAYFLARKLAGGSRPAGLLAALLVACSGAFAAWGPSGRETARVALLVTQAACEVR